MSNRIVIDISNSISGGQSPTGSGTGGDAILMENGLPLLMENGSPLLLE